MKRDKKYQPCASKANLKRYEMAKLLFVNCMLSPREIAAKLWVAEGSAPDVAKRAQTRGEVSISQWASKDHWDELRVSLSVTREQTIKNLFAQITAVNKGISDRAPGERIATSDEARTLSQLADIISKLEKEVGIAEIVSAGMQFCDYIKSRDIGAAKQVCAYWDEFLKSKLT